MPDQDIDPNEVVVLSFPIAAQTDLWRHGPDLKRAQAPIFINGRAFAVRLVEIDPWSETRGVFILTPHRGDWEPQPATEAFPPAE